MVSTLDFESSDPGSNPGRSSFMCAASACSVRVVHAVVLGVWSAIWWIMGKSRGAALMV